MFSLINKAYLRLCMCVGLSHKTRRGVMRPEEDILQEGGNRAKRIMKCR